MTKAAPCPHCGSADTRIDYCGTGHYARCREHDCLAEGRLRETAEEAANEWAWLSKAAQAVRAAEAAGESTKSAASPQ